MNKLYDTNETDIVDAIIKFLQEDPHHSQLDSIKNRMKASKKSSEKRDIWTNAVMTEVEKESDVSGSTVMNSLVNVSVSRNHLKMNILLRVLMLIVYLGTVLFVPWLQNKQCDNSNPPKRCNYNPSWLYHDGSLHMYFRLVNPNR